MQERSLIRKKRLINCRGQLLNLQHPLVMGILNITPDSFYDGGKYNNESEWIERTGEMLKQGADIIDVGAVSTRPGAAMITETEELDRLLPVLESLTRNFTQINISVDTFRSSVAKAAVKSGAGIINDISAGDLDPEMFKTVAGLRVPYIIMHIQGTPENMQDKPNYSNVVKDIISSFANKVRKLKLLGANDIIIDPGFGFGKTLEHNYELLKWLSDFQCFELPVMVGISRKSMINKVLNTKPEHALNGTTVLNTIALMNGADILRVHDVKEAVEAVKLYSEIK